MAKDDQTQPPEDKARAADLPEAVGEAVLPVVDVEDEGRSEAGSGSKEETADPPSEGGKLSIHRGPAAPAGIDWNRLARILGELYSTGSSAQELWHRAGGYRSDFPDGVASLYQKWQEALRIVRDGGPPHLRRLLKSASSDYERNRYLTEFEELLQQYETVEREVQHRNEPLYVTTGRDRPPEAPPDYLFVAALASLGKLDDQRAASVIVTVKFPKARFEDEMERRTCEALVRALVGEILKHLPDWGASMPISHKGSIKVQLAIVPPADTDLSVVQSAERVVQKVAEAFKWGKKRPVVDVEAEDRSATRRELLQDLLRVREELAQIEHRMAEAVRTPVHYVQEADAHLGKTHAQLRETRVWKDAYEQDLKLRDRAYARVKSIEQALAVVDELIKSEAEHASRPRMKGSDKAPETIK